MNINAKFKKSNYPVEQYQEGQKLGTCTFVREVPNEKRRRAIFKCKCGNEFEARLSHIKNLNVEGCGCTMGGKRDMTSLVRHGYTSGIRRSEYGIWNSMKMRCTNPNNHAWKYYGGRGIKVCSSWMNSFEAFIKDMGDRPLPKLSIDRIDNDGNYEPGNCRWATALQQAHNKRRKIIVGQENTY